MKKILFIIFLLLALFISNGCISKMSPDFKIKSGVFGINDSGEFYIKKETKRIPLIPQSQNSDFYFGVIVESTHQDDFPCKAIIRIPTPDKLTINEPDSIQPHENVDFLNASIAKNENTTKIETAEETCNSFFILDTNFHEHDKPGLYSYEIYINHKLIEIVEFNVFLPQK